VNVRLDRPMNLPTKSFMQILGNYRLSQHVSDTTHSQGGTLDVMITRDDHVVKDLCVTYVPFSDHRLVQMSVNNTKPGITRHTIKNRKWKMFYIEDFRSDLEGLFQSKELAMTHVASVGDVDTLTDFYFSTWSTLLEKHAPSTEVTFRTRRSNDWFDADCRKVKVRSRRLERRYRHTSDIVDCSNWDVSLKLKHTLFNTKRANAMVKNIDRAKGDSGALWRILDWKL